MGEYKAEDLKKVKEVQLELFRYFIDLCEENHLTYFIIGGTAIGALRHQGFIPWDDDIDVGMPRADYDKLVSIMLEKPKSEMFGVIECQLTPNYPLMFGKIEKKGTRFITAEFQKIGYEGGIALDIFPFDFIADDKKKRRKQLIRSQVGGKLLILSQIKCPVLPLHLKGIKRQVIIFTCLSIHYILKCIPNSKHNLYQYTLKHMTKYNNQQMQKISCLSDTVLEHCTVEAKLLQQLIKVPFEDLEVWMLPNMDQLLRRDYGDYMELPPIEARRNHCPEILSFDYARKEE
ncbi:MAG: LicD family protein [Cellulosilyticum sp.]|nr:LicD family protein [Cellulosilyticum sp.]